MVRSEFHLEGETETGVEQQLPILPVLLPAKQVPVSLTNLLKLLANLFVATGASKTASKLNFNLSKTMPEAKL